MFKSEVIIDGKKIGAQHPTYIIAEMSANHAQDIGKAKELVYAAKENGADAIKLQTYRADTLTLKCDKPHFYIQKGPWKGQYMYDLYEKAYMPWDFHAELFELARKIKITCFSSPFDFTAVDLLAELDAPAYKIASPELIDHDLVRYIAKQSKPIILSTGGASLAEICEVVDILKECQVSDLCLLKCTSTYPAPPNSINLRAISHMKDTFNCPIGLSDHTLGIHIPLSSIAMGACVIEKHFVMSREDDTADSFFSMIPSELKSLVEQAREVEQALGSIQYTEAVCQNDPRRCLYAIADIKKGDTFSHHNVKNLRPGGGALRPKDMGLIIGRKASQDISRGEQLDWAMIGEVAEN